MIGSTPVRIKLAGIILAGGKSSRMGGGDKCLLPLGTGTILGEVVARLAPQLDVLCLNANGESARFNAYGLPVVADTVPDCGPLGGVLAGMQWARSQNPQATHILTVAGDTPFLPLSLVSNMVEQLAKAPNAVTIAASNGQLHPTFAVWPLVLQTALAEKLTFYGARSVRHFAKSQGEIVSVDFPFTDGHDPFYNINDAFDFAEANRIFATRHP